ncbi:hypothetical protein DX933_12730 [Ornithinibacillus gellani]|uniref:hypothetical protein n=1 Tax=Ornithinibacillus gellani TaxID=2293253 RepID=UPI000F45F95D|nr:hypothetical protein [Ornithinibacillus gellani]TQS74186.1 hypothetical protein DX933_12730 [Ornithinibacillus gellani]
MKKLIVTALCGAVVLGGVAYGVQAQADTQEKPNVQIEADQQVQKEQPTEQKQEKVVHTSDDISALTEYDSLNSHVDLENLQASIKEDNANKRIILLTDENGKAQYKSIFVKAEGLHKIIDVQHGDRPIITHIQGDTSAKTDAPTSSDKQQSHKQDANSADSQTLEQLPEYTTIANHVDVNSFDHKWVATDNSNKRVVILKNGRDQVKSIYLKHSGMLKIIESGSGQIYAGSIK